MVLDSFERFKITKDRFTYNVLFAVIFLLVSSAWFGRVHYAHIKSSFGGGEPQMIELAIRDAAGRAGLKQMGVELTPFLRAKLVHENDRELIVEVKGEVFRIVKDAVVGIRVVR